MSTESNPEVRVNLNQLDDVQILESLIEDFEAQAPSVVFLTVSIDNIDRASDTLCRLRASNLSSLLLLEAPEIPPEEEELKILFEFLRDWDQLLLHNFLQLCESWVPSQYHEHLRSEAKVELKWFKEWVSAARDPRIHKVPGLPWRSYIRKINSENFAFALRFLELTSLPSIPENQGLMVQHLNAFLEAKKKVVCIFPKHWGRSQ